MMHSGTFSRPVRAVVGYELGWLSLYISKVKDISRMGLVRKNTFRNPVHFEEVPWRLSCCALFAKSVIL